MQDHRRASHLGNERTAAFQTVRGQGEIADGILNEGVQAKRHHDGINRCSVDGLQRARQRGHIGVVIASCGQRQVQCGARSPPSAGFIAMTGEVGVRPFGVAMQRDEHDIVAVIEDLLSPVAVVIVHIEHRNPRQTGIAKMLGGNGRIVEEAVAPVQRRSGVVPWRTTQPIRHTVTVQHRIGGGQRHIHR